MTGGPHSDTQRERLAALAQTAKERVPMTPSRTGALTGVWRGVRLASEYDPAREAGLFVEAQGVGMGDHVALYGLGLGHHLRPLLDAVGPEGRVIAAEASLPLLAAALAACPDPLVFDDPRLEAVAAADEETFLARWARAFESLEPGRTKVAIHLPSLQAAPPEWKKTINAVELIRMERRFPLVMGGVARANFRRNLGRLFASPGIARLRGVLRGAPAAVVGAGPSLDHSVHLLPGRVGLTILCADTAYPALARRGARPDLVVTADPQPVSLLHFALAGRYDVPLAAPPTACAGVIERWEGPVFFGFQNIEELPAEARGFARAMGEFGAGGSVSCLAVELALLMGAGAVYLFGQDFGYSGARAYAEGSAPFLLNTSAAESEDSLAAEDYFGRAIRSTRALYSYRREIEQLAARSAAPVMTVSPDAARAAGVDAVSAEEAARRSVGAQRPGVTAHGEVGGGAAEARRALAGWLGA